MKTELHCFSDGARPPWTSVWYSDNTTASICWLILTKQVLFVQRPTSSRRHVWAADLWHDELRYDTSYYIYSLLWPKQNDNTFILMFLINLLLQKTEQEQHKATYTWRDRNTRINYWRVRNKMFSTPTAPRVCRFKWAKRKPVAHFLNKFYKMSDICCSSLLSFIHLRVQELRISRNTKKATLVAAQNAASTESHQSSHQSLE